MCNICDDTLINIIGKELNHYGLFTSISKIEELAIKAYDTVIKNNPKVVINCANKDDDYYTILSSLVCGEILADTRLANSRNVYEAISALTLLQVYLDKFTTIANINRVRVPEVFMDILEKLPFEIIFTRVGDGWGTKVQNSWSIGPKSKCRLCSNVDKSTVMCKCTEQEGEPGGCYEDLTFSIVYKDLCIGFKIDPGILNLDTKIYKEDLPKYTKVVENAIDKAATELKSQAQEIFLMIYEEHKNG